MEPMKISFGFSKLTKRTTILPNSLKQGQEKKVELIECLEGQSIKVKDAVEEVAKQPLIIPLKDNQKNLLDRVREAKKREKLVEQKKEVGEDTRPDSELTADELAARELVKEAKNRLANGNTTNNSKVSVLPISLDPPTLEGEKEPTLEDYESVPISDYGLALLRGMGWKEGAAIGKNSSTSAPVSVPELRPKGLGLGATKVVQSEIPAKKAVDKDGKELILEKRGYAKIIAGAQKGNYCEVQGFDEEAGRVIVKVYPRGEIVNINEFMLVPVVKEEFSKGSKIINNAKYEVYKLMSDKNLDSYKVKSEHSDSKSSKKEARNSRSSSEEDKSRSRNSGRSKNRYESESPQREYEKSKASKYRESSESPSRQRESRHSDRDYNRKYKDRSRSSSYDKSKSRSSSKYKSRRDHSDSSALSDDEEYYNKNRKKGNEKGKSRYRSRSRSQSKSSSKKDKTKQYSSDEEYYEKDKKSKKHTKSKNRDRSRSKSRDKHKKNKKHSSRRADSSDSESDYKKDKRKKNKCKSRHRRNSSSGSEDRKYRSKR